VTVWTLLFRLQILFDVASSERYSAAVFNAYSATARLKVMQYVLTQDLQLSDTPVAAPTPLIEVGH